MQQLKYNNFNQERQIGEYTIYLPDPPDLRCIANRNLAQEKQKFIPTLLPKGIEQWDEKSRDEFEDAEWEKRRTGFWYMNNGNLEYLTGRHYFYVNWWKIDIGLPRFIDSDRDWYYLDKHVMENDKVRGWVNIENRRGGKTWRGVCCLYEEISKTPNAHGGIQSKNSPDASKVFQKLVFSWKRLPYFFKPVDIGESHPKSKLEFTEPGRRSTKDQKKEYAIVLDSLIDFENAKEEAYDGTKQRYNYQDEIGKTVEVNVNDRINIVKECVMDGSDVVGKILATTTVEEMEKKGGKYCRMVWDRADPKKLLPNGETQNGLLRYFKPADYGYNGVDENGVPFVDEYGYSDRDRTRKYIENRRKAMVNRDDVSSDRRKYPLVIHDCWVQDSKKAVYDTAKLEQQLEFNKTLPTNHLRRGNFYRKGGEKDGIVDFNDDINGRFLVAWMPKPEDRNKQITRGSFKYPGNISAGCFGLDPYDNDTTVDNRKSDAAAYGFRRFDPFAPHDSGMFILEYVNRPKMASIMWEDMIMMCQFYGWEILIESNKIGTINWFKQRGYDKYLMHRPDETQTAASVKMKEPGIPLSGKEARMALVYAVEEFVIEKIGLIEREDGDPYMGRCPFDTLLLNLLDFDFEKDWTEFDSMVGAGLALLGARNKLPVKRERKAFNIGPMFDYTKGNGRTGRRIDLDQVNKK